ncbi:MAG: ABC transporter ATP-binding protein [Candidatus Caldarchaeum sp.]|uniref:ABC transporter ATP-binding protein n=1 Tax=Caldiarchaeum subterraneum TaxID=311458 RepID=A0A7C4E151_CALS0|nr:ABC transporter ATP-binding protein [Candidatus Caldarchaeales archaeon]
MMLLEIKELWKVYRSKAGEYPALRGVNLELEQNDFVAVVGPSGSGKTTLLNLVGALDKPTQGDIILDGVSYSNLDRKGFNRLRREKIGFIFQTYNLLSALTALENVEMAAIPNKVDPRTRRRKALDLLDKLGVADKAGKKPTELSGGEQQRVAIARALINDPAIILADEPTGNLDSKNATKVGELLREVNETSGKAVLLVTHNLEVAMYADRIAYMKDGVIERVEVVRK